MHEEKSSVHERVVTHFTEEHPTGPKLQPVGESRNAKNKKQLNEVKQNANRKGNVNLDLDKEHITPSLIEHLNRYHQTHHPFEPKPTLRSGSSCKFTTKFVRNAAQQLALGLGGVEAARSNWLVTYGGLGAGFRRRRHRRHR
jgi:hypothetical protein